MRPDGLRRLLAALALQEIPADCEVRIVVVDNEGSLLTKQICEESACKLMVPLIYCCESRRGISQVRNKAVEVARQVADFLVFIDDDEVPLHGWLEHLIACQEEYDADAVCGPVVPHFVAPVPQWILNGRFFDRERYPTGTHLKVSRTNNVIMKLNIVDHIGGFDERYALIGGGDMDFFMRLYKSGGRIVWSDEAVVEEWLPPSRTQLRWLLQRAYSGGTTDAAHRARAHQSRAKIILRGTLRSGKGVCLMIISAAQGKPWAVRALQRILFGAGMIAGALGCTYEEYRKVHPV
jgi:glycosyltransferase involved in cell wall biosynthesis